MPFIRFTTTGGGGVSSGLNSINSIDGPNAFLNVTSGLFIVNDVTNDTITLSINPNSGNIFEHGSLRELLDDDHPIYWLGDASRAVSGTYFPDQSGLRDIGQRTLPIRGIHSNSGVFANDTIRLLNELIRFQGSGNIYSIDDLILNSLADFSAFGNTSATIDTYGRAQIQANEQVTLAADIDNANSGVITYDMTSGVWVRKNQTTGFQKIAVIDDIVDTSGIQSINVLTSPNQFISGVSGITITSSGTNTHFIKAESGFLATIFITSGTLGASGQHLGLRVDSLESASGYLNTQVNALISASGNLDIRVTSLQGQSGWTIEGVAANGGNINFVEGSGIARIDGNNILKTITIHTSGFILSAITSINSQSGPAITIDGSSGIFVTSVGNTITIAQQSGGLNNISLHVGGNINLLGSSGTTISTDTSNRNITITTSGLRSINTLTDSNIIINGSSGIFATSAGNTVIISQQSGSIEGVSNYLGGNINLVASSGMTITGNDATKTITFTESGLRSINALTNTNIVVTGTSGIFVTSAGNTVTVSQQSGSIEGVSNYNGGNINLVPGLGIASIVGNDSNKTINIATSGFQLPSSGLEWFHLDIGGAFETAGVHRFINSGNIPVLSLDDNSNESVYWTFNRPHNWVSGTIAYFDIMYSVTTGLVVDLTAFLWNSLWREKNAGWDGTNVVFKSIPAPPANTMQELLFEIPANNISSGDFISINFGLPVMNDPAGYQLHILGAKILYSGLQDSFGFIRS